MLETWWQEDIEKKKDEFEEKTRGGQRQPQRKDKGTEKERKTN